MAHRSGLVLKTIIYILLYAIFNVSGAAIIKSHLKERSLSNFNDWLNLIFNFQFVIAFTLIVVSALALFKALATNNFSLIIPLATGINFILTFGVGYFVFQDRVSALSLFGFALIIGGIFVLSLNNQIHG